MYQEEHRALCRVVVVCRDIGFEAKITTYFHVFKLKGCFARRCIILLLYLIGNNYVVSTTRDTRVTLTQVEEVRIRTCPPPIFTFGTEGKMRQTEIM